MEANMHAEAMRGAAMGKHSSFILGFALLAIPLLLLGCVSHTSSSKSSLPPLPVPFQAHGAGTNDGKCEGRADYSWCEEKLTCLKPLETCTDAEREAKAVQFCNNDGVAQVSVCGQDIRVDSGLAGGGSKFYDDKGAETDCLPQSLGYAGEKCMQLLSGSGCTQKIICVRAAPGI